MTFGGGNRSWNCKWRYDRHWLPQKVFRRPKWVRLSPERANWRGGLIDPSTSRRCSLASMRIIWSEPSTGWRCRLPRELKKSARHETMSRYNWLGAAEVGTSLKHPLIFGGLE